MLISRIILRFLSLIVIVAGGLESEYRLQDFQVPVDGGEILVRCLTPTPGGKTGTETYPLLVWYHLSGQFL